MAHVQCPLDVGLRLRMSKTLHAPPEKQDHLVLVTTTMCTVQVTMTMIKLCGLLAPDL